jgi:alpha-galactosidase
MRMCTISACVAVLAVVWNVAVEPLNAAPPAGAAAAEKPVILTPAPPAEPRIHGPLVYGCRPGNPFLYRIPATGQRPMRFSAEGLPAGLTLDAATGIVRGTAPARGEHVVTLRAANGLGQASRQFKIVAGDKLALTPPMGWNHWYAHYNRITDKMMREAADVMIASGMADVGYQYVNIDDCWPNAPKHKDATRVGPLRDAKGNVIPNVHFPDMKGLTDYIHSKGLKAGIYTSPGPLTCAGYTGAYEHEAQDAAQFVAWGFDFLKYDWCSYGNVVKGQKGVEVFKKPYRQMGEILRRQPRDVVYNLCQYGLGNVWEWGAEVHGHCWRTGGDLGYELDKIFDVALRNVKFREFNRPGEWNDPDYIQIGYIGPAGKQTEPQPCRMSPSQQYSFMSLWCLLASPLFYSGDMSRLDAFTLNVLCNPEVIEVDQDPLGQCARAVTLSEQTFALVKEMSDGSLAIGLFNRGKTPAKVTARWADLKIPNGQRARDLWRQRDLGLFADELSTPLPPHGCLMLRLRKG